MIYEPEAGDLVWSALNPPGSDPLAGPDRWPCLVISEKRFWQATGMAMICPITSEINAFPSSALFPDDQPIKGEILTGQLRSIDTQTAGFAFTGIKAPPETLAEVRAKLALIAGIE